MKLSDFDFDLPESLIALRPAHPREAARLLHAEAGKVSDRVFSDLTEILRPSDHLVLNNTAVIPARLQGRRQRISAQGISVAQIEITLLSPNKSGEWMALAKPAKRLKVNDKVEFSSQLHAVVSAKTSENLALRFNLSGTAFDKALATSGLMPLPPYIASRRPADDQDKQDYQSVFARYKGAVAAPTASLHFDTSLLAALRSKNIRFSEVTLHVGAGTFLPVKTDQIDAHKMHAEWGEITPSVADEIAKTKSEGGRVIPVGTTALRLLETAAQATGEVSAFCGDTDIFIRPGFQLQVADGLITNFHLPRSTLLMLVSCLMGQKNIQNIYAHAMASHYRFFSYGDACLLIPDTS